MRAAPACHGAANHCDDALSWLRQDSHHALCSEAVRALVEAGAVQLSLHDEYGLAEVTSGDLIVERLIICDNPPTADKRKRKRAALMAVRRPH